MATRDFDKEYDPENKGGHTFVLGGHTFHTKAAIHPSYFLHTGEAGIESLLSFLKVVISADDREVLELMIEDPDVLISADQLGNIVTWLIEEMSGRPTVSPDSSGSGDATTSTSLKAVSSTPAKTGSG